MPEGGIVLDIGCGVGANAIWLASEGYYVDAVDVSEAAIGKLLGLLWRATSSRRIDPRVASATNLPFLSNTFDAVIEVCVLQHLSKTDASLAIKEAYRILKPRGQMFSVIATKSHSMNAFPDGVFTRLWAASDMSLFWCAGFRVESLVTATYHDEVYGTIAHWLVRARKQ